VAPLEKARLPALRYLGLKRIKLEKEGCDALAKADWNPSLTIYLNGEYGLELEKKFKISGDL
jgi:hypothetical protein